MYTTSCANNLVDHIIVFFAYTPTVTSVTISVQDLCQIVTKIAKKLLF